MAVESLQQVVIDGDAEASVGGALLTRVGVGEIGADGRASVTPRAVAPCKRMPICGGVARGPPCDPVSRPVPHWRRGEDESRILDGRS